MPKELIRLLRSALSPEDIALLRGDVEASTARQYDAAIKRVGAKMGAREAAFVSGRARVKERFADFSSLPSGRRYTVLRNSEPALLLALFRELVESSWGERFGDVEKSLTHALAAAEVAEELVKTGYLQFANQEDLLAEAQIYLANAKRLNSDLVGARRALSRAARHIDWGTGDRALKGEYLGNLAAVRVAAGLYEEAAELLDREIALQRLLRDEEKLGAALTNRGWVSNMLAEPIDQSCAYFNEGIALLSEPRLSRQALHSLAERLARSGYGLDAWAAVSAARLPVEVLDLPRVRLEHRWIRGLAYRALGDLERAAVELEAVREGLSGEPNLLRATFAGLDLACVRVGQRRFEEAKALVRDAYDVFRLKGLEQAALSVLIEFREALEAERLTQRMAVEAVNYLVRSQHLRSRRSVAK